MSLLPQKVAVIAHGALVAGLEHRVRLWANAAFGGRLESLEFTRGRSDAETFAREAAERGAEAVVSVGGDGTVHEVLQGLSGRTTALGVVPFGTGNDFAFHLGIPRDPEAAMRGLAGAEVTEADRLEVNGRAIATAVVWGSGASIGAEAARLRHCIRGFEKFPRVARAAIYQAGAVTHILRDPDETFAFELETDAGVRRYHAWSAAIGDSSRIGGAFLAFPDARKSDGEANICVVEPGPWSRRAYTSVLLRFGLHQARPGVHCLTARRAVFTLDRDLEWLADGEVMPPARQFVCEIRPGAMPLLLPSKRERQRAGRRT